MKLGLIGNTFAGDKSSTHGKESKHIEWVSPNESPITVHVDDGLYVASNTQKRFGWILESQPIIPDVYQNVLNVLHHYECVFTHSQELLDLDPRFKFAPVGTHWIKQPRIHSKSKDVSMIASNKVMCVGHVYRHWWINSLRNKVDFFGRGFKEIVSKEEGLNDYRFSIAVENCRVPNYFTEKIGDCFATGTIPVYWGCPNIGKFFNEDGIIFLNKDLKLEDLTEELYLSKLDAVKDNFERIKQYEIPEDYIYENYKESFSL